MDLAPFFHDWGGDPKKWASTLRVMLVDGPEISAKIFGCSSRNFRRMRSDGRFPDVSMRSPTDHERNGHGLWFVQTCEFWLATYLDLEENHPENTSRQNAEKATALANDFDKSLQARLKATYRDGSHDARTQA